MEKNNYKNLRILLLSDNFCHLEKLIQEFYQENKDEISSICKFEITVYFSALTRSGKRKNKGGFMI